MCVCVFSDLDLLKTVRIKNIYEILVDAVVRQNCMLLLMDAFKNLINYLSFLLYLYLQF